MVRRIGGWLMILFSLGALAALYFVTPYLSHVQSHVLQFLSVVAAAIALVICLTLLIGGVMMRSDKMPQPKRVAVPVPPKMPAPDGYAMMLTTATGYLKSADEAIAKIEATSPTHSALWNLSLAVSALVTMVQIAARSQEGRKGA